MSVKCSKCGKEMLDYPFKAAKTCIKCTLETKFQIIPTKVISIKNREVVLGVDRN